MWVVIILTMLVGTVLGIVQTDVKRMLAYSSIAHAGFVLIGVISLRSLGIAAVLFYLLAYGLATIGAFALVTLVRERDADGNVTGEATHLSQWAGLGRRSPAAAVAMVIFLLSFAGIPLTAGFIGKFAVFSAAIDSGAAVLVVLAVLASAATAFFYVRLVVLMFFTEPDGETHRGGLLRGAHVGRGGGLRRRHGAARRAARARPRPGQAGGSVPSVSTVHPVTTSILPLGDHELEERLLPLMSDVEDAPARGRDGRGPARRRPGRAPGRRRAASGCARC